MRLPGGALAEVDPVKVRDYLLSPEHAVGRFKARFFTGLGYRRDDWPRLQGDLRQLAWQGDAGEWQPGPFGVKYEVHGPLRGPNGRAAPIVSVWIITPASAAPRLITAYPGECP